MASVVDVDSVKSVLPISVTILDLASIVPYYVGHLSKAMAGCDAVNLEVASINYHLDRSYFDREGVRRRWLVDLGSYISGPFRGLRRGFKSFEYLVNLALTYGRSAWRKPDIIHVQFLPLVRTGLPIERWFLQAVQAVGVKVVYTVHNVLPHDTGKRFRLQYAVLYAMADHLICHDESAKDELIARFGVDATRISVIAHGPLFRNVSHGSPGIRKALSIRDADKLVLWQGILRPYKGIDFLLEAWRKVQDRGLPATLAIVGSGDSETTEAVLRKVAALGLADSVHLCLRFVSVEELARYYSSSDIVVYPYREISTSGALMTGLGFGKAIIASRLPAFAELLTEGVNALFTGYGNTDELADRISLLISDDALRRRLGEGGRKLAGIESWEAIANATTSVYETVMSHSSTVQPVAAASR